MRRRDLEGRWWPYQQRAVWSRSLEEGQGCRPGLVVFQVRHRITSTSCAWTGIPTAASNVRSGWSVAENMEGSVKHMSSSLWEKRSGTQVSMGSRRGIQEREGQVSRRPLVAASFLPSPLRQAESPSVLIVLFQPFFRVKGATFKNKCGAPGWLSC